MDRLIKLLFCFWCCFSLAFAEDQLERGNEFYKAGLHADSYLGRQQAFNMAAKDYISAVEKEPSPSSALLQATGDALFQLEEYAWALVFYEKALKRHPLYSSVNAQIDLARQHLGLPNENIIPPFFFMGYLSTSETAVLVVIVTLIAFGCYSTALWKEKMSFRKIGHAFGLIGFVLFCSLIVSSYFSPLEAIVIEEVDLTQSPEASSFHTERLIKGSKIQVIAFDKEHAWFKVVSPEGHIGYVPGKKARLI